ncbi:MAG: energy transducer TonB [Verrucomicrobiota bacterium]
MTATTDQRTSRRSRRKKGFPFFLILSCLIHGALVILLAILFARNLLKKEIQKSPPPPEVTLEITPPAITERPFIEAKEVSDKAPENSPFQSDQNSKAASEQIPEGQMPLPSQQGIEQSSLELQNQRHTSGEKPASQAGNPLPEQPPSPPASPSAQSPSQQKSTQSPITTATPNTATKPTPNPQPTPTATPPPNNIKLLEPPESPVASSKQSAQTAEKALPPSTSLPHQASVPGSQGSAKGYQPETHQTVIHGNISNRGRSSVAAESTPLGRYRKGVSDAIGSRWYYYVDERMGVLSIGTVDVSFKVTASGKVSGLHVVSSNGNESLTDCSLRSIMDAKLPPIPPDVARTLQNGVLEIDYSFTVY